MEFVDAGNNNDRCFRTLHIFHFNDVYNFDPAYQVEPIGGASRFAAELTNLRKDLTKDECKPMVSHHHYICKCYFILIFHVLIDQR